MWKTTLFAVYTPFIAFIDHIKFILLAGSMISLNLFSFYYPHSQKQKFHLPFLLLCIPIVYVLFTSLGMKIMLNLQYVNNSIIRTRTYHYYIVILISSLYIISSLIISIQKYRKSNVRFSAKSIRLLIYSILLASIVLIIFSLIPSYFHIFSVALNVFAYILVLIVYGIIVTALLKYQSFDISTALNYSLFWFILIGVSLLPICYPYLP